MNVNKMLIRINKILLVVFLISFFLNVVFGITFDNSVFAAGLTDNFKGSSGDSDTINIIKNIISGILMIIRNVGVTIALAMLLIIATKYIMASASEKADIKKSAVVYVIGALVMFSASGIAAILKKFIESAFTEGQA